MNNLAQEMMKSSFSVQAPKVIMGVYILYFRGTPVYVGQSIHVYDRLALHACNKQFDEVRIIPCMDRSSLNDLEGLMMVTLKPVLNLAIPPENSAVIPTKGVTKKYTVTRPILSKLVGNGQLSAPETFLNTDFYLVDELESLANNGVINRRACVKNDCGFSNTATWKEFYEDQFMGEYESLSMGVCYE